MKKSSTKDTDVVSPRNTLRNVISVCSEAKVWLAITLNWYEKIGNRIFGIRPVIIRYLTIGYCAINPGASVIFLLCVFTVADLGVNFPRNIWPVIIMNTPTPNDTALNRISVGSWPTNAVKGPVPKLPIVLART